MEKTDITLTTAQKSEILGFLETIVSQSNTLKALFVSIDAIADPEFVDTEKGIKGIPYLVMLADEVGKTLDLQTNKIFEILHNCK